VFAGVGIGIIAASFALRGLLREGGAQGAQRAPQPSWSAGSAQRSGPSRVAGSAPGASPQRLPGLGDIRRCSSPTQRSASVRSRCCRATARSGVPAQPRIEQVMQRLANVASTDRSDRESGGRRPRVLRRADQPSVAASGRRVVRRSRGSASGGAR
jgi:hypothetical protein